MNPKVAIIILNYNSYKLTINLLEDLNKMKYKNFFVIVVDNNSPNNSYKIIKKQLSEKKFNYETIVLKSDKNRGYSSGNNIGIKKAEKLNSKYVLIMNNDIRFKNYSVIKNLVEKMESNDEIAAAGPKILSESGEFQLPIYEREKFLNVFLRKLFNPLYLLFNKFQKNSNTNIEDVYSLCGCFVLMRLKDLQKINYFDENIFLFGEEVIWGEKFKKLKKRVIYLAKLTVYHDVGSTIQTFYDPFQIHEMTDKNILYYFDKYREDIGKTKLFLLKFAFFIKRNIYHPIYIIIKKIVPKKNK